MNDPRIQENKRIAQLALKLLRTHEPEIKLSRVYELLSRAHGHRSWNVASALKVAFSEGSLAKVEVKHAQDKLSGDPV